MAITEIRLLPPYAIARFGSSPTPAEAFDVEPPQDHPLAYRVIAPRETLVVDQVSGAIAHSYVPKPGEVKFRDEDGIRPVCPFLEVYALTAGDTLEPLTLDLLRAEGSGPEHVSWSVDVANLKAFRQTGDLGDKVTAKAGPFSDHDIHSLEGSAANFLSGRSIPFGSVRYIRPSPQFPQIRLRFTPATGKVYGALRTKQDPVTKAEVKDPVFDDDPEGRRIVYNTSKGKWRGFYPKENDQDVVPTNPSDIFEGFNQKFCRGYLDDVCDGPVTVELRLGEVTLRAHSWISAAMPAFAPDSRPVRTVVDELEQLLFGPEAELGQVSSEDAADILRRAFETIRLMNTQAMNGNVIGGRANIAHTLVTQDTGNYNRLFAPIMASSLVDSTAVQMLHERIYAALKSGTAPWFSAVLRRPEEVGDLSDKARRKMPPMLRGADGRALALTRRQIDKIVKASNKSLAALPRGQS